MPRIPLIVRLPRFLRHCLDRNSRRTIIDTGRLIELGLTKFREPISFQYRDLKHATENFDRKNILGQGGFGVFYKGILRNGHVVAIKKCLTTKKIVERGPNFDTDLILLSNTRHTNLVGLLGYCRLGPELFLVYEYMEKGSLDKIMFSKTTDNTLNWRHRFDVIVGIARGLTYLHEDFYFPIIHGRIKCENILLNAELQTKIGDFGHARSLPEGQSFVRSGITGTLGFIAPEYQTLGHLSENVDTDSFGIIVLEIVSGRRRNDSRIGEPSLLEWAWRLHELDSLLELADETLELNDSETQEVKRVVQVGLMCTQISKLRPAMSQVVAMLQSKEHVRFDLYRPFPTDYVNEPLPMVIEQC